MKVGREVGSNPYDIPILPLQGRACENYTLMASIDVPERFLSQSSEPIPPVGIGQGDAIAHLLDVGLRVILYARLDSETVMHIGRAVGTNLVAFDVRQI